LGGAVYEGRNKKGKQAKIFLNDHPKQKDPEKPFILAVL
jgi:hypothetical protein